MDPAPDPSRCPLCGTPNGCAMVAGADATACWCASVEIAADVIDEIPAAARDRACVCATCARGQAAGTQPSRPLRTITR